jgi:hypothetical protein
MIESITAEFAEKYWVKQPLELHPQEKSLLGKKSNKDYNASQDASCRPLASTNKSDGGRNTLPPNVGTSDGKGNINFSSTQENGEKTYKKVIPSAALQAVINRAQSQQYHELQAIASKNRLTL